MIHGKSMRQDCDILADPRKPRGPLKLTPAQRRVMAYMLRRYRRGRIEYGGDCHLPSKVAQALGLARPTVSRWLNDPSFHDDFLRRTTIRQRRPRRSGGDLVARLLVLLEDSDKASAETARLRDDLVRQHLQSGERDDWERAIRLWERIKNTIDV